MNSETMSDKNEETPETQENSKQPENRGYVAKIKGFFTKALRFYHIFLTTIIPLCVLLLFGKVVYELVQNDLIVKSFDVPAELETQGYTGAVIVSRLIHYMDEVKRELNEEIKEKNWNEKSETDTKGVELNIQEESVENEELAVPGTGLSLESIIFHIRDLLNMSPRYIKGNIVINRKLLQEDELQLIVHITGKPHKSFKGSKSHLENLLKQASEYLLINLEPLKTGMKYCEIKKYEKLQSIIKHFRDHIPSPKEQAIALTLQACSLKNKNREIALEKLKKAIELYPDNVDILRLQADLRLEPENPENIDIYIQLGKILMQQKKFKAAEEIFEEALTISPENVAQIYTVWGESLGCGKGAEEKIETAIKKDSLYAAAYYALGRCYHRQKKMEDYLVSLERAVELEPENSKYHFSLGMVLFSTGQKEEAVVQFEKAVELVPRKGLARELLGLALLAIGKQEEAFAQFEKMSESEPEERFWALTSFGNLLSKIGKNAEAFAQFKKAIELEPELEELNKNYFYSEIGNGLLKIGKNAEAIALFERAVKLDPEDASKHSSGLGESLLAIGKHAEAIAQFEKAIKLEPENASYYSGLGDTLLAMGKNAEAIAQFEKATEAKYDNVYREFAADYDDDWKTFHYRKLGQALLQIGNRAEGIAQLEKAVELHKKAIENNQDHANFYLDFADTLVALEQKEEAIVQYKKALVLAEKDPFAYYGTVQEIKEKLESLKVTNSSDSDLKSLNE